MPTFALSKLDISHCRTVFFKLKVNGKCLFDEFWREITESGNYLSELDRVQAIIERKAQGEPVSPNQFKELKGRKKNDPYKDYEIRTENLRVYVFKHDKTGQVIVLGAIKKPKDQDRDIEYMRRLKRQYFESLD